MKNDDIIENNKKYIDEIFKKIMPEKKDTTSTLKDGLSSEFCKNKALEEIEEVRLAFINFQSNIKHLTIANYLDYQIDEFAKYAVSLNDIIEDNFDESRLSEDTLEKYSLLKGLKVQIFSDIYNKYLKE